MSREFPNVERLISTSAAFKLIDGAVSIITRAMSESRARHAARKAVSGFRALDRRVRIRVTIVVALTFAATQLMLVAAMPENSAPPLLLVVWFLLVIFAIGIVWWRRRAPFS